MRKIFTNLNGVRKMSRLPGAIIVVDAKKEHLALSEARKLGIPTIGLLDTDSDPDRVDVAIPANDDSIKAIDLILNELADAVAVGKTMMSIRPQGSAAGPGPRQGRSKRALVRADGKPAAAQPVRTESQPEPGAAPLPVAEVRVPESSEATEAVSKEAEAPQSDDTAVS